MKSNVTLPSAMELITAMKEISKGSDTVAQFFQINMHDIDLAENILENKGSSKNLTSAIKESLIEQVSQRLSFQAHNFFAHSEVTDSSITLYKLTTTLVNYLRLFSLQERKK